MASHIDAKYANGPMVAQWLEARGFRFHGNSPEAKRLSAWRNGGMADVYALDRMLVDSPYGLWELPDDVWLEARRPAQLAVVRRVDPRQKRHPKLHNKRWLERQYVERERGMDSIAEELGCTRKAVTLALRRHGIPVRGPGRFVRMAA